MNTLKSLIGIALLPIAFVLCLILAICINYDKQ